AIAELRVELDAGDGEKTPVALTVPVTNERHLKVIGEHAKYHDAAMRILHETAVQYLVNAYEHLMGDLVRRHIFHNTREAAKDKTITYRELLEYGTLEEAQRRV